MKTDYEVPTLKRIHDVLEIPRVATSFVRPAALAQAMGMPRSTLHLLLESLEKHRWVEKRADGYLVGSTLFKLGNAYLRHDSLLTAFRRESAAPAAMHNKVVQPAVLDGTEIVYIAWEDVLRPVRLVSDVDLRLSVHCCVLDEALLASLDDKAVCALLPACLTAMTEHITTHRADLLNEPERIRVQGLTTEREEVVAGFACFAVFVGIMSLGKRAAVSSSVPVNRLGVRREKRLVVGVAGMMDRIGRAPAQAQWRAAS